MYCNINLKLRTFLHLKTSFSLNTGRKRSNTGRKWSNIFDYIFIYTKMKSSRRLYIFSRIKKIINNYNICSYVMFLLRLKIICISVTISLKKSDGNGKNLQWG